MQMRRDHDRESDKDSDLYDDRTIEKTATDEDRPRRRVKTCIEYKNGDRILPLQRSLSDGFAAAGTMQR
jgi:hypothetical protein